MPIDSNIALSVRPPQIESPLQMYGQLAQVQNASNQNRLAQLQFSQAQQAVSDKNALANAYKNSVSADGSIDYGKLIPGLASSGQGAQVPAIVKQKLDYEKSSREAEKAQIEGHLQKINALGQIMGGVKDQASYDMARQQAAQIFGPDFVAQIPPQYDPAFIQQKQAEAMTVADQLGQKWKQLDSDAKANELKLKAANSPFNADGSPNLSYQSFAERKAKAGAPSQSVIVGKQETEEAKTVGKGFGEDYMSIQKGGQAANGKIARYQRLSQLLDGVNTGKLTPMGTEIASAAQSLGLNVDPNLGNKQAAAALSNEMALSLRDPSGGAGMPGALSNQDREFLTRMVPGIDKTPAGRKLMTDTAVALAKRDIEVANLARQYRVKHGSIDDGFYQELQQYADSHPLFSGKEAKSGGTRRYNPQTGRIE